MLLIDNMTVWATTLYVSVILQSNAMIILKRVDLLNQGESKQQREEQVQQKRERLKSNNINYNKATNNDKENAGKDRICWYESSGVTWVRREGELVQINRCEWIFPSKTNAMFFCWFFFVAKVSKRKLPSNFLNTHRHSRNTDKLENTQYSFLWYLRGETEESPAKNSWVIPGFPFSLFWAHQLCHVGGQRNSLCAEQQKQN